MNMSVDFGEAPPSVRVLMELVGMSPWAPRIGYGSFLTLEFGEPCVKEHGHIHGEWHLWIYGSEWRIVKNGVELANSESIREEMESAAAVLEGANVTTVKPSGRWQGFAMLLGRGIELEVLPYVCPEGMESWMLYMPNGNVVVAGPERGWEVRSSSEVT